MDLSLECTLSVCFGLPALCFRSEQWSGIGVAQVLEMVYNNGRKRRSRFKFLCKISKSPASNKVKGD